jgi:hypothetical protein
VERAISEDAVMGTFILGAEYIRRSGGLILFSEVNRYVGGRFDPAFRAV